MNKIGKRAASILQLLNLRQVLGMVVIALIFILVVFGFLVMVILIAPTTVLTASAFHD